MIELHGKTMQIMARRPVLQWLSSHFPSRAPVLSARALECHPTKAKPRHLKSAPPGTIKITDIPSRFPISGGFTNEKVRQYQQIEFQPLGDSLNPYHLSIALRHCPRNVPCIHNAVGALDLDVLAQARGPAKNKKKMDSPMGKQW